MVELLELPDYILEKILFYLFDYELATISRICKTFLKLKKRYNSQDKIIPVTVQKTKKKPMRTELEIIYDYDPLSLLKNSEKRIEYMNLFEIHENNLKRFVEYLCNRDPPSFSYQISEMMNQMGIPLELMGILSSKIKSTRLKYLITTEIIAFAFKKILFARLFDTSDPISLTVRYLNLFLGRSDDPLKGELKNIILDNSPPGITTNEISQYLEKINSNSTIFFQFLRSILKTTGIELTTFAKTKLMKSCEDNQRISTPELRSSILHVHETENFASKKDELRNQDILEISIIKNRSLHSERTPKILSKQEIIKPSSLVLSTSTLINSENLGTMDEVWVVVETQKKQVKKFEEG